MLSFWKNWISVLVELSWFENKEIDDRYEKGWNEIWDSEWKADIYP